MFKLILVFLASIGLTTAVYADQPLNQSDALNGLAHLFYDDKETPTFGQQYLDPKKLDLSLSSLGHINDYLDKVRKDENIHKNWNVVVLRAGAYVGEVIRANDKKKVWIWIDYQDAIKINPKIETFGKSIATVAVLFDGKDGFLFPLAKVEKYLINGKEDDVQFFAQVILAQ
ncbi:MAG: hypothetical protein Q7U94_07560 [Sideroxyarcus sp.]|nr:hypothetical protein [Sideroxyarcus sp.]